MAYAVEGGKIVTRSLEYSAAYHCNLRCAHCTHLSPFADATFPPFERFAEDLDALNGFAHTRVLRLLGGEPLLNPSINDFLVHARKSGIADRVMVTTNGILLDRTDGTFWRHVDLVLVTRYPGISVDETIGRAVPKARAYGAELWVVSMQRFRKTIVTEPHSADWITRAIFRTCGDVHRHHCHMIHEGFLYRCAVPPFLSRYLSRLGAPPYDPRADGFPIHGAKNPVEELSDYLDSPIPPAACRWCLGSVGKETDHVQLSLPQTTNPASLGITRERDLDMEKLLGNLLAMGTGEDGGDGPGDIAPHRIA
jgi:organic radical activating enzyme